ncbi:hypothetical protein [Anaerophilus nitritogenes]|uniref:hypothetical protein n=1 Tax=Anaerophilus nitritogenes TaxID=2498136 RepID=UPI00101B90DA|nr:hypothetical protein [Anaerophilus nitritogenes]
MSQKLDNQVKETGTRFLIYPQHKSLKGFEKPEIVYINEKPGTIQAGPSDQKMYVIDAKNKRPYGRFSYPPYNGEKFPPVQPSSDGHFDHLSPTDRAFSSATMFATVRRTLDIWEDYFGRKIPWFFRETYDRLELIPRVEWNNAHSGYGFLEFGFPRKDSLFGGLDYNNPYCENFDVLAHELGHTIKNEVIGWPTSSKMTSEYRGHHEAFADIVAIIASLHFDRVVDHLLQNTKGNLFSVNELSRVGELSQSTQIRILFNYEKMSTVNSEEHDLSLPFSGGAFDTLIEIYEQNLVDQGTIPKELGDLSKHVEGYEVPNIQKEFEKYYNRKPQEFRQALLDARDYFATLMARAWDKTSKDDLYYWKVVANMIYADRELSNGKYEDIIKGSFEWREIPIKVDAKLNIA